MDFGSDTLSPEGFVQVSFYFSTRSSLPPTTIHLPYLQGEHAVLPLARTSPECRWFLGKPTGTEAFVRTQRYGALPSLTCVTHMRSSQVLPTLVIVFPYGPARKNCISHER